MTLNQFFRERDSHLPPETIYSLGIQLTSIVERIHKTGYIYNDLNLDNLLLDYDFNVDHKQSKIGDFFEKHSVNIVDVHFATSYKDDYSKVHLNQKTLKSYRGSVLFSSINQLNFQSTSRRDDIISILYLLVYLLHKGNMPGITIAEDDDPEKVFERVKKVRAS